MRLVILAAVLAGACVSVEDHCAQYETPGTRAYDYCLDREYDRRRAMLDSAPSKSPYKPVRSDSQRIDELERREMWRRHGLD